MLKIRNNKYLVIICIVAFVVRIGYLMIASLLGGADFYVNPDTYSYVPPAISLIENGTFSNINGDFEISRTPGYPLILVPFIYLFGDSYFWGVILFQIALSVVAIVYLYKLCVLITDKETVGLVAAGIMALNMLSVCYACRVLTDSICQSVMIISVYYFASHISRMKDKLLDVKTLVLGSVMLAIAVLVRPATMYLPFAIAIGIIFLLLLRKKFRHAIIAGLLIIVIAAGPMFAWTARNATVADYNVYSATSSILLYPCAAATVYAKQNNMDYYTAYQFLISGKDEGLQKFLKTMPKYEAYKARGLEIIMSDPLTYIKTCILDIGLIFAYPGTMDVLFFASETESIITDVKNMIVFKSNQNMETPLSMIIVYGLMISINVLLLLVILVMSIIGIVRIKNWQIICLILGVTLYFIAVHCQPVGYGSYARYRMPVAMTMTALAAVGIEDFWRKIKNSNKKKIGKAQT